MPEDGRQTRTSTWAPWAVGGLVGLLLVMFALVIGPWLFTSQHADSLSAEQELKAMNDVRTTLVQALGGLVLGAGLVITYRTFRNNQLEQDRTHTLRQAEQVNEFFTTAVEQLGHAKAPVRLGAVYSLERLAQVNVEQRQTVVDVLCSYLRMPFVPPVPSPPEADTAGVDLTESEHPPNAEQPKGRDLTNQEEFEELQVRLTAQRRLAAHLRRPSGTSVQDDAQRLDPSPTLIFWPGISVDLTGATLLDLDLQDAAMVRADFGGATLSGNTRFDRAAFTSTGGFRKTTFDGDVDFRGATFGGDAWFAGATFRGRWGSAIKFDGSRFAAETYFQGTRFLVPVTFVGTVFDARAGFHRARFESDANFEKATFADGVWFHRAKFTGVVAPSFREATFAREAWFGEADMSSSSDFEMSQVLHLGDPDVESQRLFPPEWAMIDDPRDPTRGWLIDGSKFDSEDDAVQAVLRATNQK